VAWRVGCQHVFHAKCLKETVNGVDSNSNRCPLDRKEIRVARERRRVIYAAYNDEAGQDPEVEEADIVAEHEWALMRAGYIDD
jgi:hypothetical protein